MRKKTKGSSKNKQEQFSNERRKQLSRHQHGIGISPTVIFLFPKVIYKNNDTSALYIKLLFPVQTVTSEFILSSIYSQLCKGVQPHISKLPLPSPQKLLAGIQRPIRW